jgi:hypothetical protein
LWTSSGGKKKEKKKGTSKKKRIRKGGERERGRQEGQAEGTGQEVEVVLTKGKKYLRKYQVKSTPQYLKQPKKTLTPKVGGQM